MRPRLPFSRVSPSRVPLAWPVKTNNRRLATQVKNVIKLLFEGLQGAIYPGSDIWENVMYGRNLVYGKSKGPCFTSVTHTVFITPTLHSFYRLVFISAPFYWFFPLQKL